MGGFISTGLDRLSVRAQLANEPLAKSGRVAPAVRSIAAMEFCIESPNLRGLDAIVSRCQVKSTEQGFRAEAN
jgi:hypothetical protein